MEFCNPLATWPSHANGPGEDSLIRGLFRFQGQ